jgi:thiol-disulfide isomerase/thioredoxin
MARIVLLLFVIFGLFPLSPRAQGSSDMIGIYNALTQNDDWLNASRPLTPADVKGRVILVDFWTYCCINCIHVIPKLQKLEKEFGDKLTVIGVHSAKFAAEGETANIREAIQKYGIEHPVVNDADFRIWNSFGVKAWPTLMLIGADGLLKEVYSGEGDLGDIRRDIRKQIERARLW